MVLVLSISLKKLTEPASIEILDFKDSITSPKLITVKFISYEPSSLKVQSKLDTLPNIPS